MEKVWHFRSFSLTAHLMPLISLLFRRNWWMKHAKTSQQWLPIQLKLQLVPSQPSNPRCHHSFLLPLWQYKPRLGLTLSLLFLCHIVTLTVLTFRSKHCHNSLCSSYNTGQSFDRNNLALLCLGNRVSVWGKSHPQSVLDLLQRLA